MLYPMALSRLDVVTLSRIDLAAARWEQTLSGEREQLLTIATQLCQSTLTAANRCDERRLAAS